MGSIILILITSALIAKLVETIIDFWYSFPLKEEKSTPIYITKETSNT